MKTRKTRTYVVTSYYGPTGESTHDHAYYENVLHVTRTDTHAALSDSSIAPFGQQAQLMATRSEIVVKKTGRRPFGDRKARLAKAHTYKREKKA